MVTRNDVAKYAGVSNTTVSRVLNNNGYVSAENRKKIEQAIKDLGYIPNLVARSLKTKKSGQILYCLNEYHNPFYMEIYAGMEEYAKLHGYTIVVSRDFNTSMISQRQFDGVILSNISQDKQNQLEELGIPVIVNNYSVHTYELPSIKIDIEGGANSALNYLHSKGHKNIAFLTCIDNKIDQRYISYIKHHESHGLQSEGHIFTCSDKISHYEQGYNCALSLLKSGISATAAFIFNDAMAIGALAAFTKHGVSVPDDISIVSFDNILQSAYSSPALTTIDIPRFELGEMSVKMLIKQLEGQAVESLTVKTSLVERDSVKMLKS